MTPFQRLAVWALALFLLLAFLGAPVILAALAALGIATLDHLARQRRGRR